MSYGTFYAVSTGPGNPELLTLQALRILRNCEVILYPETEKNTIALDSVSEINPAQKTLISCSFSMTASKEQSASEYKTLAEKCTGFLKSGKDVAMLSIGDVSLWSTAARAAEIINKTGFEVKFVSGVNSFSEAACEAALSLCQKDEKLTIIPADAYLIEEKLESALKEEGTKILMKMGKKLKEIIPLMQKLNLIQNAVLVQKASLSDQKIFRAEELLKMTEEDFENAYLSVMIVKS